MPVTLSACGEDVLGLDRLRSGSAAPVEVQHGLSSDLDGDRTVRRRSPKRRCEQTPARGPAPATRRATNGESVVERLLEATRQELNAVGVGKFRVRSVALRARVSPGTVTHYFPTTRHLLEAVLEGFQREAWNVFEAHWSHSSRGLNSALVDALFCLCRSRRELIRARLHLTAQTGNLSHDNWRGSLGPLLNELGRVGGTQMELPRKSGGLVTRREPRVRG